MFSKLVKIKLLEKDMSRDDLCALIGCTKSNLCQMLSGDNMREGTMAKIAEALDCDLNITLTDRQ